MDFVVIETKVASFGPLSLFYTSLTRAALGNLYNISDAEEQRNTPCKDHLWDLRIFKFIHFLEIYTNGASGKKRH